MSAYTIVVILYIRNFCFESKKIAKISTFFFLLTVLIHLHYLIFLTRISQHLPLATVFEVLTCYVFTFMSIYFLIEFRIRDKSMGIFIVIIAWIFQLISNLNIDIEKIPATILNDLSYYEWHVVTMILAYSAFTISFISSIIYILLAHEIQKKQLGFFFSRLPSLELMDRLGNIAVTIGVFFISIGIVLGIMMASEVWGANWPFDPKLISVFITWLIYIFTIYLRNFRNWQGGRTAILSICGFCWILISFLVFSTIFSKIHSFI